MVAEGARAGLVRAGLVYSSLVTSPQNASSSRLGPNGLSGPNGLVVWLCLGATVWEQDLHRNPVG